MRKHHVIAFFPPKVADADTRAGNMDIRQIHLDHPNLPAQEMHDMTFVFDSE
jgi:hypothetical protein